MNRRATYGAMVIVMILAFLATSCGSNDDEKATANPDSAIQAQTVFVQVTPTTRATATSTPTPDIEGEVARIVARMANAVKAQDTDAYFDLLSQDDPVFLAEQRTWAQKWIDEPLEKFTMRTSTIDTETDTSATARLTVEWSQSGENRDGKSGGATFSARFVKVDSGWLYAGEAWSIVSAYWDGTNWTLVWPSDTAPTGQTERIRIYYFENRGPIEGTRPSVETLLEDLPGLYNVVLSELALEPDDALNIKYYDGMRNLQATSYIGLPPELDYWNQPEHSMKITSQGNTEVPPDLQTMVAHVTESLLYQLAGDADNYPAWVNEAASYLVIGENYQTRTWLNNQIEATIAQLPDEEAINPEDSPMLSAPNGVAGHVFMMYLDEAYSPEQRNAWLHAIVQDGETPEVAAEAVFGKPYLEINGDWLIWLGSQLP